MYVVFKPKNRCDIIPVWVITGRTKNSSRADYMKYTIIYDITTHFVLILEGMGRYDSLPKNPIYIYTQ